MAWARIKFCRHIIRTFNQREIYNLNKSLAWRFGERLAIVAFATSCQMLIKRKHQGLIALMEDIRSIFCYPFLRLLADNSMFLMLNRL